MCFCGKEVVYFWEYWEGQFQGVQIKMKVAQSRVAKGEVLVGKAYSNFY